MSSILADEQILVIPRSVFEACGVFQGCHTVVSKYEPILSSPELRYVPKTPAEENPALKQLIPYVVAYRWLGPEQLQFLSYERGSSGGESRLHAKISIGLGGHINDEDVHEGEERPRLNYAAALLRELGQEVNWGSAGMPDFAQFPLVCCVNDDSTLVGQVHLGFVHACEVSPAAQITAAEASQKDLQWRDVAELRGMNLESWSALVLDVVRAFAYRAADRTPDPAGV